MIEAIFEVYVRQEDQCDFNFDIVQFDSSASDTVNLLTGGVRFQLNTCNVEETRLAAHNAPVEKQISNLYTLYPNPNNGAMQLDYFLNKEEKGELEIIDMTGRKKGTYPMVEGKNSLQINEPYLNSGIYFYQIFVNGKRVSAKRLVIIK